MRIVVALGGNALLQRGQPMTAGMQRTNVRIAAQQLAPIAEGNELVISHGNGPQVGLLALQAAAYEEVEAVSARRPGRPDRGDDRLHDRAGAGQHPAVRAAVREHPDDGRGRPRRPGVQRPDQVHRPRLLEGGGRGPGRREGLADQARRRQVAPRRRVAAAQADLRDPADHLAAREGRRGDLHGRRRHPTMYEPGTKTLVGAEVSSTRTGRARSSRRAGRGPVRDGDGRRRRLPRLGEAGPARRSGSRRPSAVAALSLPAGSMGPKVEAAAGFVQRTGKRAAIGTLGQLQGVVAWTHGTRFEPDAGR